MKMSFGVGKMMDDPKDDMRRVLLCIDSDEIFMSEQRYHWKIASEIADEWREKFKAEVEGISTAKGEKEK